MFTSHKKNFFLVAIICITIVLFFRNAKSEKNRLTTSYNEGINKIENEEYQDAQQILGELGDYKDSLNQIEVAQALEQLKEICDNAIEEFNNENYIDAIKLFEQIEEFKTSKEYTENFKNNIELFEKIDGFKNSTEYIENSNILLVQKNNNETLYNEAYKYYESGNYILAIKKFTELNEYKDSEEIIQKCRLELAKLQQATTISAGIRSSVGMISNGKVYLAGNDVYSWKSELDTWKDIISISVKGNFVVGLNDDGTVIMAGKVPEYYVGTKTWNDVIAISTGQQYIIGLRADGTLVAQGHNGDHQVDNIDDWTDIVAISTGWRHTVGLDSNGEIYIAGLGKDRQLAEIDKNKDDWTNIVAISAGGGASGDIGTTAYTVALKQDGTVVTTLTGTIADEISKWEDIIAISAGDFHIVGLKADGTVVTTQTGQSADEISEWKDIVAVSAGYGFTLGLKADGTVEAFGYDNVGQINVKSWEDITNYEDEWKSIFDEELRWNGNK